MQVIDFEQLGLVIVESRPDFIAPKMCTITMNSLLTAGGKEQSFGPPNEYESGAVNNLENALTVPRHRQNPARSVANMGSDAGCSESSSGWACNNRDAWPPAPAGTMHRSIGHRRH